MKRVVVVGASLAGLRAVEAARRTGFSGSVTLVGAEQHLPYDRPPLSKGFLDVRTPAAPQTFRSEAELREELDVALLLGTPATGLDARARVLDVGGREVAYDALVVATGASPRQLPGTEGIDGVHTLRTLEDAVAVREALDAGARTVVVGAGFVGSEVASAARKRGLPVTIVESMQVPLTRAVGVEAGAVLTELHRAAGTELVLGTTVAGVEAERGRATGVRLGDGRVLAANLVVVGMGVTPSTSWLEHSGIAMDERDGGILCDATLRTSDPAVYAAGDVAHVPYAVFDGDVMRLEHWTTAAEQGAAAGRNAVTPDRAQVVSAVPYFWSDWYSHRIQFVGTTRAEEVHVVDPGPSGFLALYRRDATVVGALSVDRPRDIMKLRRRIAERGDWAGAVELARSRVAEGLVRVPA